jgi:hypothetical protein
MVKDDVDYDVLLLVGSINFMHSRREPVGVCLSENQSLRVEMNRGTGGAVCARVCSNHLFRYLYRVGSILI